MYCDLAKRPTATSVLQISVVTRNNDKDNHLISPTIKTSQIQLSTNVPQYNLRFNAIQLFIFHRQVIADILPIHNIEKFVQGLFIYCT